MRFPLSVASVLALTTSAVLAAEPKIPTFKAVDVDTQVQIGYGLAIGDVDGDGKPDIILADKNIYAWYKNPTWEKFVLAEKVTPIDHVCLAAEDIDGDGKVEIAVGAGWNPGDTVNSGAVFYLIPPADRKQKWEPVQLPHEPTVHRMRWVKNGAGKFDLVVVPLHGRGNKNGAGEGVKVLAYKMPANPRDPWKTELVNGDLHMTHNFNPIQWTAGGAEEMLLGGKEGVLLLENAGGKWNSKQLVGNDAGSSDFIGAGEIRAGKLAGGTRFLATVEPMHGTQLVSYTPPAAGKMYWTRNVLDPSLLDGHAVACGDLGGNGYDQIVVGWRAMNKAGSKVGIKLFTPMDSEGKKWQTTLVDDNTMACEDLLLADLNGDAKLDIIAAGRATKNLKVYFNQGAK